jgi:hypothetical protein
VTAVGSHVFPIVHAGSEVRMSDGSYGSSYHQSHHGGAPQGEWSLEAYAGQNAARSHDPPKKQFENPDFGDFTLPTIPTSRPIRPPGPGEPTTFGEAIANHFDPDTTWGKTNRFLTPVGLLAGLGFGVWKAFLSGAGLAAPAAAVEVLKWTFAGLAGGMLFTMALVAALSVGILLGILALLGLLLNVLTGT